MRAGGVISLENSTSSIGEAALRTDIKMGDGSDVGVGNNVSLKEYLANLPCDIIVFTEQEAIAAFTMHDHVLLRSPRIEGSISIPMNKTLTVLPPIGQRYNLLGGEGKKFILNRGSQLYAPSLAALNYDFDAVTINGSTRPAMLLGVGRPVVAEFTLESEYGKGRGLVMDASTNLLNDSGIIAGIKVNASIKGMGTAYEEIAKRNGTENRSTYINNNEITLTIWQCRRGLIQQEYVHGVISRLEIAGNNYFINYQTDGESKEILKIYGVRNTVDGHVWDLGRGVKLNPNAIYVGGYCNTVGSSNFPSITNEMVYVEDISTSRNNYRGITYGTDREDIGHPLMIYRPYQQGPKGELVTIPGSLHFNKAERNIPEGTNIGISARPIFCKNPEKLPLSMSGFAFIRNASGRLASVSVGFGLSSQLGENALSQTYEIADGGLVKVPITVLYTATALYIECGSTLWRGTRNLLDGHISFVLSMTNNVPVTLCGCVFTFTRFDY